MNLPGARFYDDSILDTLSDDEKYDFSDYGLLFYDAMLAQKNYRFAHSLSDPVRKF